MNKVIELGRLTRDPEVRYTQSGKVVCTFTLAVDRFGAKDGEQSADFIPIVVYGKVGELCGNSLIKGSRALVDGRLQIRSYEAKDGSGKRWVAEVIANTVQFLDKKNNAQNTPEYGYDSSTGEVTEDYGGKENKHSKGEMESFGKPVPFEEEIPF